MDELELPLRTRLNLETGRITWQELGFFFARGRVLQVAADLDLIEVASALANDEAPQVSAWLKTQQLSVLSDLTAKAWAGDDQQLWAVVVAPWVVVQQRA
ncbi:hypothetical protein SAMN02745130_02594 [Thiothrix eikelboomii]|uniref:DUF2288 domain-containing protein n=1 Tax=Thiothrix eikelboomii TaxID=92487 RepID=A0A1T4X8L8_9GAMM|nr:DUF2288 family protein [Thiothrix eikelboomii]SKA85221.1 hypothetical protein SAMN02745130_02594 [Thiothrix eikelboomii]